MPIYNWLGGAEVSHTTGENYKKKVIDLLELNGFILIGTSSDVSMTPDLIFRKPDTEGKMDIYVETKFSDVSLSNKDFLSELVRYFILYMSNLTEPFDLYLYVRKLTNFRKWMQIFSANSYNEKMCKSFFNKLSSNETLNEQDQAKIKELDFNNFKNFISDTYVHQIDYNRLLMKIEEKKKEGKNQTHGYDYYLRELPPIKQKQQIIGNFAEIEKYSGSIYSWNIGNAKYQDIYYTFKRYEPIILKGRSLYSLEPINNQYLKRFIDDKTIKKIDPEDWFLEARMLGTSDKLSILQTLYKKYFLNLGISNGCNYRRIRSADLLYFSHADYSKPLHKVDGKQVTRLFADTTSPFVKHEAIEIEVKIYGQRLFVFFSPTIIFSDENKEIITGIGVKRLHNKFSPNKYDTNLSILGDMKWWFNFLCGKEKTLMVTSDLLSFVDNLKPPQDGKTRNQIAATELMEKWF